MDRVRVRDVCKEEVLAFRLVRNRQDAPLGAIFLLGNRARQWRVYHLQFPTTNRIALTPALNTFSQHSSLTSDRFASGCDARWALSFFFFFFSRRGRNIFAPLPLQWDSHLVSGWSQQTRTDLLSEEGRWQSQLCTSRCWWWWSPWPTQHPVNGKQPLSHRQAWLVREKTLQRVLVPHFVEKL